MKKTQADAESISGIIENVVYYNDTTDYAVIEIVTDEDELITAVGSLPIPAEGERVSLVGSFGFHREFGKQFVFDKASKTLPVTEEDIYKYLSSQIIKGIGPKTARRIVDKFGKDTFDVMEKHPEWLVDIPGITMKRAAAMSEAFIEQNGLRTVVMFCKEHDIDISDATRFYKELGSGAVGKILENPYILCEGTNPISFKHADDIAKSVDFDMLSDLRLIAGVKYELSRAAWGAGHTCLPREELIASVARTLEISEDMSAEKIDKYIALGYISAFLQNDVNYILLNELDSAEDYIASHIVKMDTSAIRYSHDDVEAMISKVESYSGILYATAQRRAIYEALSGGVMILTGGPGTGKTTVVKALLSIFYSMGLKTVLAAPTGRAAKRMSEATAEEAKTIHRMLDMEKQGATGIKFGRNEANPLDEAVVIVDEASMIDVELMAALLRAMRRNSRLILIGDSNQLPSVGAGNLLADLIATDRIRTVELQEIFRQSSESLIVTNAHKINHGESPNLSSTDGDFFFVRRERESDIPNAIAELITKRLPAKYGRNITDGIQVITPSKQGAGGVISLNAVLQAQLNPSDPKKAEKSAHGVIFREGDRVMQTVNNYELNWERDGKCGYGIFNGDIGTVKKIDNYEKYMIVSYDEREVLYSFDLLHELELAYAITVHKSQGSEYPVVIIPSYNCPMPLMTRNLLYTAITRARRMVIMVGRADVPYKMVKNNREVRRYTTLTARVLRYL